MRRWLAIVVFIAGAASTASLAGCRNPDVERLRAIKDKVCACATTTCAEQEIKTVPQTAIASTHRTQAIARDLLDCLARLRAAERPSTDPDDEDADAVEPADETSANDGAEAGSASDPRTAVPASAGTP